MELDQTCKKAEEGFRPLNGDSFCKLMFNNTEEDSWDSFRPVIGVSFCKQTTFDDNLEPYEFPSRNRGKLL